MNRRAFMHRMAAAALAGMLGVRLEMALPGAVLDDPAPTGVLTEELLRKELEAIWNADPPGPNYLTVSPTNFVFVRSNA